MRCLEVIKRDFLPAVVSQLPFGMLHGWAGPMPMLPYYHGVGDEEVCHVKHLYKFRSVRQFKSDLDTFLRYYQPVTLHDLLAGLDGRRSLPPNAFMLSFDDGFREVYDVVAPILLEKGVSATIFIIKNCLDNIDMVHHNKISLLIERLGAGCSKIVNARILEILAERGICSSNPKLGLLQVGYGSRSVLDSVAELIDFDFKSYLLAAKPYLTSEQIQKLLRMGFTIGGHSIDHPVFASLALEDQLYQTRESVRFLRERFNLNYAAFCFPHHDANVGRNFFQRIYSEGEVDISFGTSGMVKEEFSRHFQRFPMEKSSATAKTIIAYNYARSLQRRLIGCYIVCRN
jgi:peptidoglycan/xylan/chitin deacetylase (PgdA/CDA1 family)